MPTFVGQKLVGGRIPGQLVGDVSVVTADSATFTTTETQVQTVTVPLVSGRTYKVCWMPKWRSTATGDSIVQRIREDSLAGNELQVARVVTGRDAGTTGYGALIVTLFTAVATANKTFSFTGQRGHASDTGTINLEGGGSHPNLAWVEYWYG